MLKVILNILYRWYWLIILAAVLTAGVSYLIFRQQPTTYRATALLLVGPSTSSPNPALDDLRTSGQLLETYGALATTRPILEGVIHDLSLDTSVSDLEDNVDISTTPETQILSIRVFDEEPNRAIDIANGLATRILNLSPTTTEDNGEDPYQQLLLKQIERIEERITTSEGLIEQLQETLTTATTREERIAILNNILQERSRLSSTEQFLVQLYDTLQRQATNRIEIVEPATQVARIDPQTGIKTVISAFAGLILGLVAAAGLEYFNNTVTASDDLPLDGKASLLGVLRKPARAKSAFAVDAGARIKSDWKDIEAYRGIVARLQSAQDGSRSGRTILLTGTPDSERLAEVVVYLGTVISQMGQRVVLVDANYHTPGLTRLFKLADKAGLSEAVTNGAAPAVTAVDGINGLSVVATGKTPPSSFVLLSSDGLDKVIGALKRDANVIIVAAPDVVSSDTTILGSKVDDVIIAVYTGLSDRSAVHAGLRSLPNTVGIILVDHSTGLRRFLEQKASI